MLDIDDLKKLKELRLQAGLTQKALAKEANTTQSTIAKIEKGDLAPSIKRAKQILNALKLTTQDMLHAKDIMTTEILSFLPSHPLKDAITQLTNKGFSQAPVIEGDKIIGKITEATVMSKSIEGSWISILDKKDEINKKISKAYCPVKQVKNNPILQISKLILFPKQKVMKIERDKKYGGDLVLNTYEELERVYAKGGLHPADLKKTVAHQLDEIIRPIRASWK